GALKEWLGLIILARLKFQNMPKAAMIRFPGIQTVRKFTANPLPLRLRHRRLDRASDASRDFVLNRKYVGQIAVIRLRPHVRARCCLDELGVNTSAIARFAHATLEDVTHPSSRPICLMSTVRPLYVKLELRAMTKSQRDLERAVMMSSAIPSAKYSCSASPLIFWKARTAIEGLSGSASATVFSDTAGSLRVEEAGCAATPTSSE